MGDNVNGLGINRDPIQDIQAQQAADERQADVPRDQVAEDSTRSAFVKSDPRTMLRQVTKTNASSSYGSKRGCALPGD